jgi:hypothetical protein
LALNDCIAAGGDSFTVLTSGREPVGGPIDLDAFIEFLARQPQPVGRPLTTTSRIFGSLHAVDAFMGLRATVSLQAGAQT